MTDPRFPEGDTNPEEIECQLINRPKFPEKCIKMKKIGPKEARPKIWLRKSTTENASHGFYVI